jgi:hypothetical protein
VAKPRKINLRQLFRQCRQLSPSYTEANTPLECAVANAVEDRLVAFLKGQELIYEVSTGGFILSSDEVSWCPTHRFDLREVVLWAFDNHILNSGPHEGRYDRSEMPEYTRCIRMLRSLADEIEANIEPEDK